MEDDTLFSLRGPINIGNKPDVQPDVSKPVQLSEEPEKKLYPDLEQPEPAVDDQPKATRQRRKKRGRPPMTKAAKKAAKAAKKAPAKSAALSSKKETALKSMPMSKMTPAVEARVNEFQPREGTIRKRLLIALCSSLNKPLERSFLQSTLYGEINDASKSALGMVLKGVAAMIVKEKLKYALETGKNGDGEAVVVLKSK